MESYIVQLLNSSICQCVILQVCARERSRAWRKKFRFFIFIVDNFPCSDMYDVCVCYNSMHSELTQLLHTQYQFLDTVASYTVPTPCIRQICARCCVDKQCTPGCTRVEHLAVNTAAVPARNTFTTHSAWGGVPALQIVGRHEI